MATLQGTRARRFGFVTAAHHFLFAALPLRHPESNEVLHTFVAEADRWELSSPDREAVLLGVLAALEPHTGGRLPSLVDRYFGLRREAPGQLERFGRCVEDILRYRGIGDPHVQQAVAILFERCTDPALRQAEVAETVGLGPAALCAAFRGRMGCTFVEFLREVRLDRAAALLMRADLSVKEVWAAIGYSDRANFNHDFRRRFAVTPTDYRASALPSREPGEPLPDGSSPVAPAATSDRRHRLLIVDDDSVTCDTLGRHLAIAGYAIDRALSGREGLERSRATRPDAVVLDFHLGDLDGFEYLRALRSHRPQLDSPVLVFTADWDIEDCRETLRELGAAVMSKLADPAEVESVIASLLAFRQTDARI